MDCENCWYNDYDEDFDDYYCMLDLDEDLIARMLQNPSMKCPYYKPGDEYTVARKQ